MIKNSKKLVFDYLILINKQMRNCELFAFSKYQSNFEYFGQ